MVPASLDRPRSRQWSQTASGPLGQAGHAILIIDADRRCRTMLATYLSSQGFDVHGADDSTHALALLAERQFDIVFAAAPESGAEDLSMLRALRQAHPDVVVVLMTARASVENAGGEMCAGAYDHLVKPLDLEHVRSLLERVFDLSRSPSGGAPRRALEPAFLQATSPAMQRVVATSRTVAASDVTVLITGEGGTGKSRLARTIHDWSPRRAGPFVAVPCATIDRDLSEMELSHQVRRARAGTLYLDDIGDLAPELQAKLLHLLGESSFERIDGNDATMAPGPPEPRLIAATKRDLEADVRTGRFREDLFYRLSVVSIALPPLRERCEDIPALTDHILQRLAQRHRRGVPECGPDVRQRLCDYEWPGNVRELENALERAVVLSGPGPITLAHLPGRLQSARGGTIDTAASAPSLKDLERDHVRRVLAESSTLGEAAARLGIDPSTLWRMRKRWGLE
ncbi:MAG TPA: sigma-54 dependent transcriptional regulator [Candidatus Eisenbacteria bacterium]|nr:sigma-54 dependent transcriptional regulator [Candidatus Eisenbacteria bacterium]